jgi:hypothetical protein
MTEIWESGCRVFWPRHLTSVLCGCQSPPAHVLRPARLRRSGLDPSQSRAARRSDRCLKGQVGVRCLQHRAELPFRFGLPLRVDRDRREQRRLERELGGAFAQTFNCSQNGLPPSNKAPIPYQISYTGMKRTNLTCWSCQVLSSPWCPSMARRNDLRTRSLRCTDILNR